VSRADAGNSAARPTVGRAPASRRASWARGPGPSAAAGVLRDARACPATRAGPTFPEYPNPFFPCPTRPDARTRLAKPGRGFGTRDWRGRAVEPRHELLSRRPRGTSRTCPLPDEAPTLATAGPSCPTPSPPLKTSRRLVTLGRPLSCPVVPCGCSADRHSREPGQDARAERTASLCGAVPLPCGADVPRTSAPGGTKSAPRGSAVR